MLRSVRPLLATGLTLLAGLVIAQSEDRLPQESACFGDIRRGPDGKLPVMSEVPATDPAARRPPQRWSSARGRSWRR